MTPRVELLTHDAVPENLIKTTGTASVVANLATERSVAETASSKLSGLSTVRSDRRLM